MGEHSFNRSNTLDAETVPDILVEVIPFNKGCSLIEGGVASDDPNVLLNKKSFEVASLNIHASNERPGFSL